MKTILFVAFVVLAQDQTVVVSAATTTEFGSAEACTYARTKLSEAFVRLHINAVLLCGPYDVAKLQVETPSKTTPKTETPVPPTLEQQMEELRNKTDSLKTFPKPQHFMPPETPLRSTQAALRAQ